MKGKTMSEAEKVCWSLYHRSVLLTDLQSVLTELYKALDDVVLCLSQQLLDSLTTFGQDDGAITQVTQDAAKVFPITIDQYPA